MSIWKKWVNCRATNENNGPADMYRFNNEDGDLGIDYERLTQELFQLVWKKYTNETMQFLNGIAQRGDEEINLLLRKLEGNNMPVQMKKPSHSVEEIIPPDADRAHGEA